MALPSKPKPGTSLPIKVGLPRKTEISMREAAIKRRLAKANNDARNKTIKSIDPKKGGTKSYTTQSIKTGGGFTKSDYGVGSGAAIPYQLSNTKKTITVKKRK
ncbi:hypothetical protein [Streptomyces hebeiensis]